MTAALALCLTNQLPEIHRLTAAFELFCDQHGIGPDIVFPFTLAFDEVVTNIVSYAYADAAPHAIQIDIALTDGMLEARVSDDGAAFDPLAAPEPDLEADIEHRQIGGLGVFLVRKLMDCVAYRRADGRNILTFAKRLPR